MTTDYTFGPYRYFAGHIVGPDCFSETIGEKPSYSLVVASLPTCIQSYGFRDEGHRHAVGHMMAAAPDMLEALKTIVEIGPQVGVKANSPMMLAARVAIAKAEGRA